MTYEEEQIKYAEELKKVTFELRELEDLFSDSSLVDEKIWEYYKQVNPLETKYQLSTSQYEIQKKIQTFRLLLESDYHKKRSRKQELERLLSKTISKMLRIRLHSQLDKHDQKRAEV